MSTAYEVALRSKLTDPTPEFDPNVETWQSVRNRVRRLLPTTRRALADEGKTLAEDFNIWGNAYFTLRARRTFSSKTGLGQTLRVGDRVYSFPELRKIMEGLIEHAEIWLERAGE